jgi:hypothetical protein
MQKTKFSRNPSEPSSISIFSYLVLTRDTTKDVHITPFTTGKIVFISSTKKKVYLPSQKPSESIIPSNPLLCHDMRKIVIHG